MPINTFTTNNPSPYLTFLPFASILNKNHTNIKTKLLGFFVAFYLSIRRLNSKEMKFPETENRLTETIFLTFQKVVSQSFGIFL